LGTSSFNRRCRNGILKWGKLQEEIYMNVPEGLDTNFDHCLQLKKAIYRLVQSAREFHKKLILVLKSVGLKQNNSDPCVLLKWHEDGVMLIVVIGNEERIAKLIVDLMKKSFNLKVESSLCPGT
jgi:hypothetical protein